MSLDVVVFAGDTVDDAAVCGVDVGNVVVTGGADFFDPAAGFFGDFFFALAFVVSNVDVDARELCVAVAQGCCDNLLEAAKCFGAASDQDAIEIACLDVERDDVFFDMCFDFEIFTKKRDNIAQKFLCKFD